MDRGQGPRRHPGINGADDTLTTFQPARNGRCGRGRRPRDDDGAAEVTSNIRPRPEVARRALADGTTRFLVNGALRPAPRVAP
ncbi:hypothetical protein GCM10010372_77030 [Streptomyces tauricus]|nr:hypothetical protein GCM10010372_77030 [Streptomyces tauricus]